MNETEIYARIRGAGLRGVGDLQEGAKDPAIHVAPENLLGVLRFLRHDDECVMDMLHNVSAVERADAFEVWYHLCSLEKHHSITLWTNVAKPEEGVTDSWHPSVPSAVSIYQSADWHEREQWDLLGVHFEGHPDLRRILLPEEWIGFPLRKTYVYPQEFGGVPLELDAKPMYEREEGEPVTTGAPAREAGQPLNQPPSEKSKRPHAGGKAPPKKKEAAAAKGSGSKADSTASSKGDGDDAAAKAAKLAAIKAKMAKSKDGKGGKSKGDDKQGKDG
ncbi:MAG: hypothetical protein DHS20C15_17650 [Planctomycetota bacterium]|nr:MAG: hypothetical protein DHS20C15_17650 [Planctomycetota bacterium]